MNKFPEIKTIDDIAQALESRPGAFYLKPTDFGFVANYHSIVDAFGDIEDEHESMRRELRGIKFNKHGELICRPLHKFFNLGEKKETKHESLPWHLPHRFEVKQDGSMLTVTRSNGVPRLMTKAGITETSERFEADLRHHLDGDLTVLDMIDEYQENNGLTLIFEGVAPWNRIVLGYSKVDIILLAARKNLTGEYLDVEAIFAQEEYRRVTFNPLGAFIPNHIDDRKSLDGVNEIVGTEGLVVSFSDGTRVKVKTDWYRSLHASRSDFSTSERRRLELALLDRLDDVMPILNEEEKIVAEELKGFVSKAVSEWTNLIEDAVEQNVGSDQKTFALSSQMSTLAEIHPVLKAVAFTVRAKNADARETLIDALVKVCAKTESANDIAEKMRAA